MQRTKVSEIYADQSAFGDKRVTLGGWVRTIRDMKNFGFIELNDGSCFRSIQIVFEKDKVSNYAEIARRTSEPP